MATYEIIQLHAPNDPTRLLFPRIPLEAICESPDKLSTPLGTPVRCVELLSMTSTTFAPTKPDQHYYNTADHKLYTSVQQGKMYVWNNGEALPDGLLYRVAGTHATRDTLYIKSINESGQTLSPLTLNSVSLSVSGTTESVTAEYIQSLIDTAIAGTTATSGLTSSEVQSMIDTSIASIEGCTCTPGITSTEVQSMIDTSIASIEGCTCTPSITSADVQTMIDTAISGLTVYAPGGTSTTVEQPFTFEDFDDTTYPDPSTW